MRSLSLLDSLLTQLSEGAQILSAPKKPDRPSPAHVIAPGSTMEEALTEEQRSFSGSLMRVNHVGEICAQALYQGQAMFSNDVAIKQFLIESGREELDHLAWTHERLVQLRNRPSFLNPVWYLGSFALGAFAARMRSGQALGFVVETERQVEAHLKEHLERLPAEDFRSRAIVNQMANDEASHADTAKELGAEELPAPAKAIMKLAAKVMTRTAHYL